MPPDQVNDQRGASREDSPDTPIVEAGAYRRLMQWTNSHRTLAILIASAGLLSITVLGVGLRMFVHRASTKQPQSLDRAWAALNEGNYEEVARYVDAYTAAVPEDHSGDPDFLRGAATAYQAFLDRSVQQDRHCLMAAEYLQEAQRRKFSRGRAAEGLYLLGKSLYLSGQNTAARPILKEALKAGSALAAEIHFLLAEIDRSEAVPMLAEAETENRAALADRHAPAELHRRALLQQVELLLASGKVTAATAALAPLGPQQDAVLLFAGAQIAVARAFAAGADRKGAKNGFPQAIELLRRAQAADPLDMELSRRTMYLLGVCLAEAGNRREAITQFQRTERTFPHRPEGLAALVHEAELLLAAGRNDEALAAYRRALQTIADAGVYSSPWMSLAEFRKHVMNYYQAALERQDFATAVALCTDLGGAFPQDRAWQLAAQTHRAWGHALLKQADDLPIPQAEALRRQGRKEFRRAGRAYYALAGQWTLDRRQPSAWWESIQAFLDGHDYRQATVVLEEYLQKESSYRHPEVMAALGEARLVQGHVDEAIKILNDCVTLHPHDASAFRARLWCARAYREKGDFSRAETLLRENLHADLLTPASVEWRESLFDLGSLLYVQGRYAEAIARLEEAVTRWPDLPRTIEARYLLADACRCLARAARETLPQALAEDTRRLRTLSMRESLQDSLHHFQKLRDDLNQTQESEQLTPSQKLLLRNTYFAVGDVYFELGQYEDAIHAYQSAVNRYQNTPAALEGYSQIIHAQRRLSRAEEAHTTAEQAKLMLHRIQPDSALLQTTNRNRQQWEELFNGS